MTADSGWREPASTLALRYGGYRARYVAALTLLFGGGAAVQLGSAYTLAALSIGVLASVAGWVVVPAAGWRRAVAVAPAVLGVAGLLAGAASGALLCLALAGWLLVRSRPLIGYLALVLPATAAAALAQVFPHYAGRAVVAAVLALVVVGAAWLARSLAAWNRPRFWAFFQRDRSARPVK